MSRQFPLVHYARANTVTFLRKYLILICFDWITGVPVRDPCVASAGHQCVLRAAWPALNSYQQMITMKDYPLCAWLTEFALLDLSSPLLLLLLTSSKL